MSNLLKISDSKKNLDIYSDLYSKCFLEKKFKLNYLDWLYNENPDGHFVGIDCFENENLIAQAGGIPHEFILNQKKVRVLVSVNVCVNPKYQGKWIFSKMLHKLEKLAQELNFDGIIGIANKEAYPFWLRSIKMKKLKSLDVFIGLGKLNLNNLQKSTYNFYTCWTQKKLNWRIKNPNNKTFIHSINNNFSVYSKTKYLFFDAYSPLIFYDNNLKLNLSKKTFFKPIVYLGLIDEIKKTKFLYNLPEFLKPSPLHFIYKFFKSDEDLDSKKIFFTFLDFDIF
jgi:GNAT superfamily N-acetyltransferase